MKIFKFRNMGELLPQYPQHWVVCAEKHPEIVYRVQNPPKNVDSYLWYNMALENIPGTYTNYFREKLAITDELEAMDLIAQWNWTVDHEPTELEFDAVFPVRYAMMGIATDPEDASRCLILATYPVRAPYCEHVPVGGGGYMWQYLDKASLEDNKDTHLMLAERFALWDKRYRMMLLRRVNKLLGD